MKEKGEGNRAGKDDTLASNYWICGWRLKTTLFTIKMVAKDRYKDKMSH